MIERITKNENRFDSINSSVKELSDALEKFRSKHKDFILLEKYYGSKNWFKDKEAFEKGKITNIKAGVLSEDGVWNMFEEITELVNEINQIVKLYDKTK